MQLLFQQESVGGSRKDESSGLVSVIGISAVNSLIAFDAINWCQNCF